jgi:glycosyltransferase involved in cell wall biosynthesis
VTYRGFVASADAFLASAKVVAVPTRYGSGVETKVLTAIQSGAPTVATSASARGLGSLPSFVVIADHAETFARRLVAAIAAAGTNDPAAESAAWLDIRRSAFVRALRDAAGLTPAQYTHDEKTLALSVVMPTHNRSSLLPPVLASLSAQTCDPGTWELIAVNDGSTDQTADVLKRFAATAPFRVTILEQKNAGPGAARNGGASIAAGKRLLFLDDDMIASERLIFEHARHSHDPLTCVIGHIAPPKGARSPWMAWEDVQLLKHAAELAAGRPAGPRDVYSGNVSVPAALVRALGGYRVNLKRGEDFELGYRLAAVGATFVYGATAISTHLGTHEYTAWIRNAAALGRAEVALRPGLARDAVLREAVGWFEQRHLLNRTAVRLCSTSPAVDILLRTCLQMLGRATHLAGARRLTNGAYSALYNIAYWQGLIENIGPTRFWSAVKRVDAAALEQGRSTS